MTEAGRDQRTALGLEDLTEPPELYRVVAPDGERVGELPRIDPETMVRMLDVMLLIRQLDERMMILQRQGRIGFYGACTGQEAPPIGTAAALDANDWIFPGLREGAAMLYRGFSLESYVCQVFGNSGDVLKGRQMPSHYADRSVSYVSWGSCIGTQLPQAVGAAWAQKLRRDDAITVGFSGDGGTSEADFHTAMTFAKAKQAPVVLICQNNHWSISVPTARQTNARTIAEKAVAYGIPYARVDGNDVLAVFGAVQEAAARARSGRGPSFLEMLTYRIGAHSSSDDPRVYRDEREVDEWKKRDPIARYVAFLENVGHVTTAELEAKKAAIAEEVAAAIKAAESKPPVAKESLFDDVYATLLPHLREQRAQFLG